MNTTMATQRFKRLRQFERDVVVALVGTWGLDEVAAVGLVLANGHSVATAEALRVPSRNVAAGLVSK